MIRVFAIILAVIMPVVFSQPVMAAKATADGESISQGAVKGKEASETDRVYSSGDYQYKICGGGVSIVRYTGNTRNLKVPETITAQDNQVYRVTEISACAFKGNTGLVSVELPEELTSIGEEAFADCTALSIVELPYGLITLEANAFRNTGITGILTVEKR